MSEKTERMSDDAVSVNARDVLERADYPAATRILTELRRARASEASVTADLSALRAEHQRTRGELVMRAVAICQEARGTPPDQSWGFKQGWEAACDTLTVALYKNLSSDAGKGWVSPEEHQRVVAERDAKQQGLEDLARTLDAASFPPGLSDIWTAADLRMRELKQARAALAASEEKARELEKALRWAERALDAANEEGLLGGEGGSEEQEEFDANMAPIRAALSPSSTSRTVQKNPECVCDAFSGEFAKGCPAHMPSSAPSVEEPKR
jgi:hypothetical protein